MATKLKNNKLLVTIISCLVLVGLSVGMYMTYPNIEEYIEKNKDNYFEYYSFYEQMRYQMYLTYIEALENENSDSLTIVEKLYDLPTKDFESIYKDLLNKYYDRYNDDEVEQKVSFSILNGVVVETSTNLNSATEENPQVEQSVKFSQLSQEQQLAAIKDLLVEFMRSDIDELRYQYNLENLYYFAVDQTNNQTYSYNGYSGPQLSELSLLLNNRTEDTLAQLKEDYQYFLVLDFDTEGNLTVSNLYGVTFTSGYSTSGNLSTINAEKEVSNRLDSRSLVYNQVVTFTPIKNMTFVYGVPTQLLYSDEINQRDYWPTFYNIQGMSFFYDGIALIALALFALIIPLKSISNVKFIKRILKWPIESLLLTASIPFAFFIELLPNMIYSTIENRLVTGIPEQAQAIFTVTFNLVVWFAVFTWMFILFLYIKSLFKQGWKVTFTERCWTYRVCRFFFRKLRKLLKVDLKEKNTKKLFFLVGIQCILLSLFCLGWFFGIIGVFIYSIVLYVLLRKYLMKTQKDYVQLFEVTEQLAEGNLEVEIDEDLGIFNAFKEEVMHIQGGFKKAVEAEVRSQRMKTDLIANVSHDLKTPLTSIITYTDLLKDEDLDKEKRAQYLETLDQKAQRLKILIEDLFEMSKASSGNITMNLQEVEVISLMKQTLLELEDKIDAANLIIRRNFPEHKVLLMLDSERTFRVFDNLILNMTKYAMPHTRAYINIVDLEQSVQIIFRNMSADEINVDVDELTERFVRGDQSRHTEGSGLGLAIAKSFVELQGGTLDIHIDGDLFKVILTFNK